MTMMINIKDLTEWEPEGETEVLREYFPVAICQSEIPYDQTWNQTGTATGFT